MEEIRAEKLVRRFKDGQQILEVLHGIDLTINSGEFVSITGASGTGKSTLVYQLGLLDVPSEGDIYLRGQKASELSIKEKTSHRLTEFGFVFQDYALLNGMKAWENVAIPMLMRGCSLEEAKHQAEETLNKLGLDHRINALPSQLSGGESQRVSIARAIVHKPAVLFADEPTANLDTERSRSIINLFHELHKEGQTIVMVTHEIEYADEASRCIVLDDGKISKDFKLNHG